MTKYTATIRHHSISRARSIDNLPTLTAAKRAATKEFGAEQLDYTIVVYEMTEGYVPRLVASRKVGASRWTDCAL